MSESVTGINPKILKWARERANYSLEDIAAKFKKDIKVIENWESGEKSPTYTQLEKLAYELYKRPIALFFFPEPPEEADERQEFRTLPEFEIENLSPDTLYIIRQAKAMQLSLKEINDDINPSDKKIFREIIINFQEDLSIATQKIRDYLGISLEKQFSWKDDDTAFKSWRNTIEKSGIFIFKTSFKQKDISGFCLIDKEFPIIYLNNSMVQTRQIFTIFHELAHILLQTNGITKLNDTYINSLQGDNRKIEIFCNRFAAEFLVPSTDLLKVVTIEQEIDDNFILSTASRYKVSREVVLRKLLDLNLVNQNEYERKISCWQQEYQKKSESTSKKSGGGNYYATQAAYLGDNYLKLVFGKYYKGKYGIDQLADYLNIKPKSVESLEQFLLGRKVV